MARIQFTGIYRCLRPLLADELGFLDTKNATRLFKTCCILVMNENRSFIILGNFPLSFGSLATVSHFLTFNYGCSVDTLLLTKCIFARKDPSLDNYIFGNIPEVLAIVSEQTQFN